MLSKIRRKGLLRTSPCKSQCLTSTILRIILMDFPSSQYGSLMAYHINCIHFTSSTSVKRPSVGVDPWTCTLICDETPSTEANRENFVRLSKGSKGGSTTLYTQASVIFLSPCPAAPTWLPLVHAAGGS